ncbi:MAG: hypothetical protein HF314_13015 [Ignavibacteria bacterium]|jgi:hypothetical protein|nr:hypothetical protein [Ignavibacteria bacterium]MCU7503996.1 hypothetical protein [Ignavibacteria bacterium]MCU7515368.1 hypothetical protein [Ignavibacteria bacterium]
MTNEVRNKFFWVWLGSIVIGIILILSIFFMEERHNSAQPSTQGTTATSPQSIQKKDSVGQVNK